VRFEELPVVDKTDPDIDSLVAAFYGAFDNRGGRAVDGAALRALFADGSTITRVNGDQADVWTPDQFIAPRVALLSGGGLTQFHEWETLEKTTVLDHIASRWSVYAKAGLLNGADYRGGGQKFIQFRRREGRWRISAVLWEDF
jgi:hypothetical protein